MEVFDIDALNFLLKWDQLSTFLHLWLLPPTLPFNALNLLLVVLEEEEAALLVVEVALKGISSQVSRLSVALLSAWSGRALQPIFIQKERPVRIVLLVKGGHLSQLV